MNEEVAAVALKNREVFSTPSSRSDLRTIRWGVRKERECVWYPTRCQPFAIVTQVLHQSAELDLSGGELQFRASSRMVEGADLLHHTSGFGVSPAPHTRNEGWNTSFQYSFVRSTFRCATVNLRYSTRSVAAHAPFGRVYLGAWTPTARLPNPSPTHILYRFRIRPLYPSFA
jgi:hypothetical protein